MRTAVTTIERFILDQEKHHPSATGELSNLLYDIALACKLIAAAIRRAGLSDILGSAQNRNVQGEDQQKLDVLANDAIKESLKFTGRVCVMGIMSSSRPSTRPASTWCSSIRSTARRTST